MNSNEVFNVPWFARVVFIVWLISSVFIVIMLSRIDGIVHGELYDFGLSFSYDWATPYWFNLRLIYICLAFPAFLTIGMFVFRFWNHLRSEKVPVVVRRIGKVKKGKVGEEGVVRGSMLIACSNCGKRFSRPILMLDFSGDKARLVNVCPFCGAKLGENSEMKKTGLDIEFGLAKEDEEKVEGKKSKV